MTSTTRRLRKWLRTGRVGGVYRMSFTQLSNGQSHSFGGKFLELVPGERLRHTDLCARLQPTHKLRLVQVLQAHDALAKARERAGKAPKAPRAPKTRGEVLL